MKILHLAGLMLVAASAVASAQYTVQDLGTIPNNDVSYGLDVNDNGQVIGRTLNSVKGRYGNLFFWSAATGIKDMGFLVFNAQLNNSGYVIDASQGNWVWRYGENGNVRLSLPGLGVLNPSVTTDINNSDEVAGRSNTDQIIGGSTYVSRPVVWNKVGGSWTISTLPQPYGDNIGSVSKLTDQAPDGSEQAVGFSAQVSYVGGTMTVVAARAVRWVRMAGVWSVMAIADVYPPLYFNTINARGDAAGNYFFDAATNSLTSLAALTTEPAGHGWWGSGAHGIDSLGNLCATVSLPEGFRATRWDSTTGTMTSLGSFGTGPSSASVDYPVEVGNFSHRHMTPAGQIVGWASTGSDSTPNPHAFIWDPTNGMRDLNLSTLTPSKGNFDYLRSASAISNAGYVTGTGHVKKGNTFHAYLLIPRP